MKNLSTSGLHSLRGPKWDGGESCPNGGREGWEVCVEDGGYTGGRVGGFGHVDDLGAHVILSSVMLKFLEHKLKCTRLAMSTC